MKFYFAIALCLLGGCTSMPETEYYILGSDSAAQMTENSSSGPVLGIGRVRLADYLRQSGIVTQTDDFRIRTANYHRWGEPLHKGIRRNLARLLSQTMVDHRIEAEPHDRRQTTYQLDLEIERFHANTSGMAILSGRWTLYRVEDETIVHSQDFSLSDPMNDSGYQAAVGTQMQLLGRLGDQISAATQSAIEDSAPLANNKAIDP